MDSLFDQSKLIALAERLIKAARAAGADTADAVAMRSVSQSVDVRDGAVEESQRSEGDDMGLRVLIGRKQAVVSTNDMSGDGVAALAERAVAMARVAPEDKYAGLADPALLAKNFPDLDSVRSRIARCSARLRRWRAAPRRPVALFAASASPAAPRPLPASAAWCSLTSHGFSGAYLGSRHSISMQAIAGEGTGMETDYDFSSALHASDLDAPEKIGRAPARRPSPAQPAQGLDQESAGGVRFRMSPARSSAIWSAPSTARPSRARRASSRTSSASGFSPRASTSSTTRCAAAACARGRSTPRASPAGAWR